MTSAMKATKATRRWWRVAVAASMVGVVTTGCGLPDGGATRVDDESVPYRLLEPADPPPATPSTGGSQRPSGTLVFWVEADDGLVPTEAAPTCDEPVDAQVSGLLDLLSAGPTDEERSAGWSSAWVPPANLSYEGVEGSTAVVAVDATTRTPADRLPVAIGQVTLSVTTAADVSEVRFTDGDGRPIAVPLPGGAFTEDPVGPTDYLRLVEGARSSPGGERWAGCP